MEIKLVSKTCASGQKSKPYAATLFVNKKNVGLGNYETAKAAAIAYNEAVIKYNKPLAFLNKIPNE